MKKTYKNVPILRLGREIQVKIYLEANMAFLKSIPITVNWDKHTNVGAATNFKIKRDRVYCDVEVNGEYGNTLSASTTSGLEGRNIATAAVITSLSFAGLNMDEKLNHNLRNREVKIKNWRKIIEGKKW